jgi:hypothetical protein
MPATIVIIQNARDPNLWVRMLKTSRIIINVPILIKLVVQTSIGKHASVKLTGLGDYASFDRYAKTAIKAA